MGHYKITSCNLTARLCSVYVAVLMNYLESHSFRAFVVRKRSSLLVPDATASCSHLATSFILFPENDFEIIIRVELTFKSNDSSVYSWKYYFDYLYLGPICDNDIRRMPRCFYLPQISLRHSLPRNRWYHQWKGFLRKTCAFHHRL